MHGDEPSATPALLDVGRLPAAAPRRTATRPPSWSELTLLVVPMLNPDGAERYQRRNAQAIDINRDALNLATPEGRLLKAAARPPPAGARLQPARPEPPHHGRRHARAGDRSRCSRCPATPRAPSRPAACAPSARAPPIAAALEPFVPGGIARYDEDWSPRAFGDNLTAWGTPVVLIESGGLAPGRPLDGPHAAELRRAARRRCADLAADDLAAPRPGRLRRACRATRPTSGRTSCCAAAGLAAAGARALSRRRRVRPSRAATSEWAGCGARAGRARAWPRWATRGSSARARASTPPAPWWCPRSRSRSGRGARATG